MVRPRAGLEWPMVTIWAWRDMNELSFLQHVDSVPFAFRYEARLARMQFNDGVRLGLACDLETSRNHIEYLVPVRMDFASVRRVILNRDDSHGHAIDSDRRTRLMGPGGHGEITVNVEQVIRDIDWSNSAHQKSSVPVARDDTNQSPRPNRTGCAVLTIEAVFPFVFVLNTSVES